MRQGLFYSHAPLTGTSSDCFGTVKLVLKLWDLASRI